MRRIVWAESKQREKCFVFFCFSLRRSIQFIRNYRSSTLLSIFRRSPDGSSFSPFATTATSANPSAPFPSMPYLKTSPYLLAVDPLHSMGYSAASKSFFFKYYFMEYLSFCFQHCKIKIENIFRKYSFQSSVFSLFKLEFSLRSKFQTKFHK